VQGCVAVLHLVHDREVCVWLAEAQIPRRRVGEADVFVYGNAVTRRGSVDGGGDMFGVAEVDEILVVVVTGARCRVGKDARYGMEQSQGLEDHTEDVILQFLDCFENDEAMTGFLERVELTL
jgi:hypothetical protein